MGHIHLAFIDCILLVLSDSINKSGVYPTNVVGLETSYEKGTKTENIIRLTKKTICRAISDYPANFDFSIAVAL